MQNYSVPKTFESDSRRRPFDTLRVGMGILWKAIGIYFGSLKPHGKTFGPEIFESDLSQRPFNTIGIAMGALWCAIGVYFGILKSHAKTLGLQKN